MQCWGLGEWRESCKGGNGKLLVASSVLGGNYNYAAAIGSCHMADAWPRAVGVGGWKPTRTGKRQERHQRGNLHRERSPPSYETRGGDGGVMSDKGCLTSRCHFVAHSSLAPLRFPHPPTPSPSSPELAPFILPKAQKICLSSNP